MYQFPKSARVCSHRHYRHIAQNYTRHIGKLIVIDARQSNVPVCRLGITVTRRYGNAVKRNRFKRLVKESFRLNRALLPAGFDLNIKPRTAAQKSTMMDIASELLDLASKF